MNPGPAAETVGLVGAYCKLWPQGSHYEKLRRLPLERGGVAVSSGSDRRATHTPPTVAAEIAAGYQAGETVTALADRFNVHRSTVHNLLDAAGVPRRPRGLGEVQAEQAVAMYAEGLSIAKIARHFGLAPSGIDRLLKRRGVVFRDRHARRTKD